jgi:CheY-like chemotaxis protein
LRIFASADLPAVGRNVMNRIDQGVVLAAKPSAARAARLLVVEDECLVAFSIVEDLVALGYTVVGPAFSKEAAQRLAAVVGFDGALVDINLNGENGYDVAEILRSRGIPFVFVSGYQHVRDTRFKDVPVLQKPFVASDLESAVDRMLGDRALAA